MNDQDTVADLKAEILGLETQIMEQALEYKSLMRRVQKLRGDWDYLVLHVEGSVDDLKEIVKLGGWINTQPNYDSRVEEIIDLASRAQDQLTEGQRVR